MRSRRLPLLLTSPLPLLTALGCAGSSQPHAASCGSNDDCPASYFCDNGTCSPGFSGGSGGQGGTGGTGGTVAVDNDPPTITFVNPNEGEFINNPMDIFLRIRDASTITSVTATIGDDFPVALTNDGRGNYTGTFDLRILPDVMFRPNLNVTAVDEWGHSNPQSVGFWIDTTPPVVGIGGPGGRMNVWLYKDNPSDPSHGLCSEPFNPLGSKATKHGDRLLDAGDALLPRARVEDRGNLGEGGLMGGIDPSSVRLYVLDSEGLQDHTLLSTSGLDTAPCDIIDPDGVARSFALGPIPISGHPDYTSPPDSGGLTPPAFCANQTTAAEPGGSAPSALCPAGTGGELTMWLGYGAARSDGRVFLGASIFALAWDPTSSLTCGGDYLDMSNFADGTACLAVAAADQSGNLGISEPIAICIDLDATPGDCVGWSADAEILRCSELACTTEKFADTTRKELAAGSLSCGGYCTFSAPGGCLCVESCLAFPGGNCCEDVATVCQFE